MGAKRAAGPTISPTWCLQPYSYGSSRKSEFLRSTRLIPVIAWPGDTWLALQREWRQTKEKLSESCQWITGARLFDVKKKKTCIVEVPAVVVEVPAVISVCQAWFEIICYLKVFVKFFVLIGKLDKNNLRCSEQYTWKILTYRTCHSRAWTALKRKSRTEG